MDVAEGKLTLTAQDFQRGLAEMPENVVLRRSMTVYSGLLILAGGVAAWLEVSLGLCLLWIAFGLMLMVLAQLRTRRAGARLLAGMQEGTREVSYRFDAQGVSFQTSLSEVSMRYAALHRQHEGSTAFLLYTQDRIAHIVPKRAFDSAQLEQIRRWLAAVQDRPRPKTYLRMLVLWAVLVLCFLAVWQFLVPSR